MTIIPREALKAAYFLPVRLVLLHSVIFVDVHSIISVPFNRDGGFHVALSRKRRVLETLSSGSR